MSSSAMTAKKAKGREVQGSRRGRRTLEVLHMFPAIGLAAAVLLVGMVLFSKTSETCLSSHTLRNRI